MVDKRRWLYLIGAVVGASVLSAIIIYSMTKWVQAEETRERESSRIQLTEAGEEYQYRITSYRGHIGIYDAEGYLKSEVMVRVELLPQQDQKRLKEGIYVDSEDELYALMEDFTG